jgi:hypothetical protein
MEPKRIIMFTTVVGLTIGGFVPALWGSGGISFSSIIFSAIGGVLGIYAGYKLTR